MLKNYFKIAFRGYLRNGKFTALNLLSLVIGLFVAFVGVSYLIFETGYDQFHQNSDRIYRVAWSYRSQDYSIVGFPSSESVAEDQLRHAEAISSTPGVEHVLQFITSPYPEFIQSGDSKIQQEGILTTNTAKSFGQIFSWQPILGTLYNFGSGVRKVMLTESGFVNTGTQLRAVPTEGVPPGTYYAVVETANQKVTRKIVILQ